MRGISFVERYLQGDGYAAIRRRGIGPRKNGFLIKTAQPIQT
jgi:hypothetical protein